MAEFFANFDWSAFLTSIEWSDILSTIITLLFALALSVLVRWAKNKLNATQLETLRGWVKIAVQAGEQLFKGTGRGAEKKQYVLDFLASKGVVIDTESIEALIESAVQELK